MFHTVNNFLMHNLLLLQILNRSYLSIFPVHVYIFFAILCIFKEISFQAWARLCKCLGQEFLPYMSVVMPPLLRSAQLKPDVTIMDADSEDEGDESDDDRYGLQITEYLLGIL